jgi:hypothetical protein
MTRAPLGERLAAAALILSGVLAVGTAGAQQQNLGNKILGTAGLDAGKQADPGLYLVNRYLSYAAYASIDRNGNRLPNRLALGVVSDALGITGTLELKPLATYVGVTVSVPFSRVSRQDGDVQTSIDTFGLADMYFQPLRLGWRLPQVDLVAGFAVYIPTGHFEPGGVGNLGSGQWSSELSLGSTVYLDPDKAWWLSALSTYQSNLYKRDVDIRRGATLQIQGGAGVGIEDFLALGPVGYALWQVSDDTGTDLPVVLERARDRAFGLGAEVDFLLAPLRSKLVMRYAHDLSARSRPLGQIFAFALAFSAWKPSAVPRLADLWWQDATE